MKRRPVSDPVFEHMAVNLLPSAIAFIREMSAKQVRVPHVPGQNAVNILNIVADVAEGLAIEKYGKPRFRVPAATPVSRGGE